VGAVFPSCIWGFHLHVYSPTKSVRSIEAPKIDCRVPTDRMLLGDDLVDPKP
jgi:hypothetical protein